MWAAAVAAEPVRAGAGRARRELRQETVRLWGTLEAQLAATLREHEPELAGLEITTCLREGELEIVTRFAPDAQPAYDRLGAAAGRARTATRCSPPGPTLDDLVAAAFADRGLTVATAESCTGGLLAARLTARPGVVGVGARRGHRLRELGQGAAARRPRGPARRARRGEPGGGRGPGRGRAGAVRRRHRGRHHRVAGPGGGTAEKPVGTVHLCVVGPDGARAARAAAARLPDGRAGTVRHDGDAPAPRNCWSAARPA